MCVWFCLDVHGLNHLRFSFYWPKEFAGNPLYFMVNIVISGRFSQPIHWIHCSLPPSRLANSKQPRQVMLCTSETGKLKWEKLRNTEDLYRDPHFTSFHHLIKWDFQYVTSVQPPQSGLVQVCHEDILPHMRFSCGKNKIPHDSTGSGGNHSFHKDMSTNFGGFLLVPNSYRIDFSGLLFDAHRSLDAASREQVLWRKTMDLLETI